MEGMTEKDLDRAIGDDRAQRAIQRIYDAMRQAEEREAAYAKESASVLSEVALLCASSVLVSLRTDTKFGERPVKKINRDEIEWFLDMADKTLKLARSADNLGDLPMARMGNGDIIK